MADLGRSPDQRVKAEIGEAWPQPRFFCPFLEYWDFEAIDTICVSCYVFRV